MIGDVTSLPQVRAIFWRITTVLYIDVQPQTPIHVTVYSRAWSSLQDPDSARPRRAVDKTSVGFFAKLTRTVLQYLEDQRGVMDMAHPGINRLTLQVVKVTWLLLQFGFYDQEDEVAVRLSCIVGEVVRD